MKKVIITITLILIVTTIFIFINSKTREVQKNSTNIKTENIIKEISIETVSANDLLINCNTDDDCIEYVYPRGFPCANKDEFNNQIISKLKEKFDSDLLIDPPSGYCGCVNGKCERKRY